VRRFAVLLDLIDIWPGQHILEIGGGRGVFAEIILDRLGSGRYVGVDRSSKAVAASQARNQRHVASGLAEFVAQPLDRLDPERLGRFDVVVAVNVNLFWTGTSTSELSLLSRLLAPSGRLWIAYNYRPIAAEESQRLASIIGARLTGAGLSWDVVDPDRAEQAFVLTARHKSLDPFRS
jgi:SAM-dependent methyltransferase